MKAEFIRAAAQVDEPLEHAQYALRNRKRRRPKQHDPAAWFNHTMEFAKNLVDLFVREVLHDADIPDAIDRIVLKGEAEDVAAGSHVHHGMAAFQHRADQI